jgi:hypothetical protein
LDGLAAQPLPQLQQPQQPMQSLGITKTASSEKLTKSSVAPPAPFEEENYSVDEPAPYAIRSYDLSSWR